MKTIKKALSMVSALILVVVMATAVSASNNIIKGVSFNEDLHYGNGGFTIYVDLEETEVPIVDYIVKAFYRGDPNLIMPGERPLKSVITIDSNTIEVGYQNGTFATFVYELEITPIDANGYHYDTYIAEIDFS